MTHCDLSVRSDVIIGSDKDQNRGCKKKDKSHVEILVRGRKRRALATSCMS